MPISHQKKAKKAPSIFPELALEQVASSGMAEERPTLSFPITPTKEHQLLTAVAESILDALEEEETSKSDL